MSARKFPRQLMRSGALDITALDQITDVEKIRDIMINHVSKPELELVGPGGGLGVYRSRDFHLIGLLEPSLHEHERWLYMRQAYTNDWYQIQQDLSTIQPIVNVTADLGGLRYLAFGTKLSPHLTGLQFATRLLGQLHARQSHLGAQYLGDVLLKIHELPLSREDRHDLMYHYGAWQVRNPGYADLPRDLALRMHGFAPLLEAQQWLPVPYPMLSR